MEWLILLPALWLLLGMPWMEDRRKRKSEAEQKARDLEWELMMLHAERGREGLEAKLVADLRAVMVHTILHASTDMSVTTITEAVRGNVPEDLEDLALQTDYEWKFYFWPVVKPRRVKR